MGVLDEGFTKEDFFAEIERQKKILSDKSDSDDLIKELSDDQKTNLIDEIKELKNEVEELP